MRRTLLLILCAIFVLVSAGCGKRVRTYTYQEKRVDQDLSRGNKGVVFGDVPAGGKKRKTTRTMAGIDIILPDTKEYKARKAQGIREVDLSEEPAATEIEEEYIPDIEVVEEISAPAEDKEYKVQKGDTLQKISKRFFGTTTKWPQIYEANKDVIRDPARIYPGQVITIPGSLLEEEEEDIK